MRPIVGMGRAQTTRKKITRSSCNTKFVYYGRMKNVTITVEDATLEWVRIEAARRNTSVSRLVGEMLTDKMQFDDAYARAQREWVADTSSFSSVGKTYPRREVVRG